LDVDIPDFTALQFYYEKRLLFSGEFYMNNDGSEDLSEKRFVVPWKKSLKFRLTASFVVIQLILGAVMMLGLSHLYQDRIEGEYITKGTTITKMVASLVDGEMIDSYLETLEKDERYENLLYVMRTIKKEIGVEYLYIIKITGNDMIYVFDTDEAESQFDLGQYDYKHGYEPDIFNRLRNGEYVEPYITNFAEWGWLVSVYTPIYRADGSVAAYAGADISMTKIMNERSSAFMLLGFMILLIFFVSVAISTYIVRRYVITPLRMLVDDAMNYYPENEDRKRTPALRLGDEFAVLERAMVRMEMRIENAMTELIEQEKYTNLMLDTIPLACQLWSTNLDVINCNEASVRLYGFKNKQECIDGFIELTFQHRPGGTVFLDRAAPYIKKAFQEGEGSASFQWTYKLLDGSFMPSEITIVKVNHKNENFLVVYTKDLRDIEQMENKILMLETEVDKIYYDGLTGIYNRRFFDENLERLMKSMSRSGGTLSLMMIDIDRFKNYNDLYGHTEGDTCLKLVAETIAQTITRADDFAARYGGEEFVIVLPNTDENGARIMAHKIIENIMKLNIPHAENTAADCVTVSVGVATGKVCHTQSAVDYIKFADDMLYRSKQGGRNRSTSGMFEPEEIFEEIEETEKID
jgi:diguanylate cyclase (GGDEF)-like protein